MTTARIGEISVGVRTVASMLRRPSDLVSQRRPRIVRSERESRIIDSVVEETGVAV